LSNINLSIPKIKNQKIFFCVLNWGIGHATRSIPIIDILLKNDNELYLFTDGEAKKVLNLQFPNLTLIELPSYNIKYQKTSFFMLKMFFQLKKIKNAIEAEQKVIEKWVNIESPDWIISDNRYGCFSNKTKNIIITHQFQLKYSFVPLVWLSKKVINHYLKPFDEAWIPDDKSVKLSGELASCSVPITTRWIGLHSDLKQVENPEKEDYILVLLSGPEPRRSMIELQLLSILSHSNKKIVFIAGNFLKSYQEYVQKNIQYFSYKERKDLSPWISGAKTIICRSGYTTLIDLYCLAKKDIICIPTLGQIEQEYLAEFHAKNGFCRTLTENEIESKLLEMLDKDFNAQ
jgi:uncharacterized protein (TIGR00661 family)